MSETEHEPIVCTLDATGFAARLEEFAALFTTALVGSETTRDGIRFRFAAEPGIEDTIRDLARREQICCPFFRFEISKQGEDVWWDATVDDPQAAPLLDELLNYASCCQSLPPRQNQSRRPLSTNS